MLTFTEGFITISYEINIFNNSIIQKGVTHVKKSLSRNRKTVR